MMATLLWTTPHPWKSVHNTDSHRCLEKPSALPRFPQAGRRTKLSTQSGNLDCRSEGILIDVGQAALIAAWRTVNYVCGKRLVPFLPELIPTMERHGHLSLSDKTRADLLELSAATADRIFRQFRFDHRPHGKTTTKSGQLLKHHVPIRTFADWADTRPGFMEADLVAHCGGNSEGPFLHTLVLTDVATGWTECLALLRRTEADILQALTTARQILPFQLVGLDTDNGSEFMNYGLLAYCERETIQFTRGRARRKNDQCFVEQKNGSIVRQLVGYDRYEGSLAYRQLAELYRVVRLYVNFFQPSMKLTTKTRDGSRVTKRYDIAQTPYQRLSNSDARSTRRFAFALLRFMNVRIRSISYDSLRNSRMHSGDMRRNWPLPR